MQHYVFCLLTES